MHKIHRSKVANTDSFFPLNNTGAHNEQQGQQQQWEDVF